MRVSSTIRRQILRQISGQALPEKDQGPPERALILRRGVTQLVSAGRPAGRPAAGCRWSSPPPRVGASSRSCWTGACARSLDGVAVLRCVVGRPVLPEALRRVGRLCATVLQQSRSGCAGGRSGSSGSSPRSCAARATVAVSSSRCFSRSPNISVRAALDLAVELLGPAQRVGLHPLGVDPGLGLDPLRPRTGVGGHLLGVAVGLLADAVGFLGRLVDQALGLLGRHLHQPDHGGAGLLGGGDHDRAGRARPRLSHRRRGGLWVPAAASAARPVRPAVAGADCCGADFSASTCFLRFWFSSMSCAKVSSTSSTNSSTSRTS